jgi:hypothetical protein
MEREMEVVGVHGAIVPTALRRQAMVTPSMVYFWPVPETMDLGGGFSPDLGYLSLPL